MKKDKEDTLRLIFEPYVLNIMRLIEKEPKRFSELGKTIRTKRTLQIKISKLLKHRLIETIPIKIKDTYATYYKLTEKGKRLIKQIELM